VRALHAAVLGLAGLAMGAGHAQKKLAVSLANRLLDLLPDLFDLLWGVLRGV
jgi:hypothetical protein